MQPCGDLPSICFCSHICPPWYFLTFLRFLIHSIRSIENIPKSHDLTFLKNAISPGRDFLMFLIISQYFFFFSKSFHKISEISEKTKIFWSLIFIFTYVVVRKLMRSFKTSISWHFLTFLWFLINSIRSERIHRYQSLPGFSTKLITFWKIWYIVRKIFDFDQK